MSAYETIDPAGRLECSKCKVKLVGGDAVFEYMGSAFPVVVPVCPICGFVYVPESLALSKVLQVEKSLENK